ncbi:MAG: hypothetical protein IJD21_04255 [Oscillospiraceae bacterium]|nr:hypothetical protein [Oscillospiraceae bacterium]
MNVLLRDREDGTLIAAAVTAIYHWPEAQELYIDSGALHFTLFPLNRASADQAIRTLYETGKADLTRYQAIFES